MDFYAFLLLAHKRLAVLENSCLFFHKEYSFSIFKLFS